MSQTRKRNNKYSISMGGNRSVHLWSCEIKCRKILGLHKILMVRAMIGLYKRNYR